MKFQHYSQNQNKCFLTDTGKKYLCAQKVFNSTVAL